MVFTHAYVFTGVHFCTSLTHDDAACCHNCFTEGFNT
jgi:hypothetical protein